MSSNVNQPQDLERRRVSELQSYQLDTSATPEFDQLTDLASRIFDVPIALISLVDDKRQFFKSRVGLAVSETPRDISFCAHAIAPETTGPLLVPDALSDARFVDNPLVTGPLISAAILVIRWFPRMASNWVRCALSIRKLATTLAKKR